MMKLYRPLCSDVTLRLAVDISPGYDDTDDDTSVEADDEHCEGVINGGSQQLRGIKNMATNHDNSENNLLKNQNVKHHSSRGHNHSCSWYSRHNTPDKTAKDIYNHEHISDASLDNIQTISLDSEFKRCVEEGGNDFKDDTCHCELVDNRLKRCHQSFPVMDTANSNRQRTFNQYFDTDLSCCFSGDTGLDYETSQSHIHHDGNGSCECTDGADCDRLQNISVDRNDNICRDEAELNELDPDDDIEHQGHVYSDDVSSGSQEELPIDLDEDIDVIDKMVMKQSMTASHFGEMEDSDIGECMQQSMHVEEIPSDMSKSIAEEIHEVLLDDDQDETNNHSTVTSGVHELPFSYPFTLKHVGHLFDKSRHHFTTPETKKRTILSTISASPQINATNRISNCATTKTRFDDRNIETTTTTKKDTRTNKCTVSTMTAVSALELEVTHRGLHRFIPRHKDEMNIGIGDPIHVIKECDDLWCEGINLRTGEKGIFPAMYANDLHFLEESDEEDEYWKFNMRFLGSVEVTSHKGDETLVHAINKVIVSHKGNINAASLSTLEINQYGIRMIDKSKEGHEKDAFSHFFALKNISFCGTHPKDNRYFAFITKHPRDYKFACHVFHGDRPTHRARDALGAAFKRFYQEYMAFTHPTEDIYME